MLAPLPLAGRSAGNAPLFCLTSLPAGAQGELLLLLPLLPLLLLYGQHLHVLLLCGWQEALLLHLLLLQLTLFGQHVYVLLLGGQQELLLLLTLNA